MAVNLEQELRELKNLAEHYQCEWGKASEHCSVLATRITKLEALLLRCQEPLEDFVEFTMYPCAVIDLRASIEQALEGSDG